MTVDLLIFALLAVAIAQSVRARHYRRQWKREKVLREDANGLARKASECGIQWMNKYYALKNGGAITKETEWPELFEAEQ